MLKERLTNAFNARADLHDQKHEVAFRLFNGFFEGAPNLVIDLYGKTAVIHNYADPASDGDAEVIIASQQLQEYFPWLEAILLKVRKGDDESKIGTLIYGKKTDTWVREHGVRYAVELTMNRDCSMYLDTRYLRHWLLNNCKGKDVLNTFAYTGSLGVAAYAGGAKTVVQTDLNKRYLNVSKTSYTLNGFPIVKDNFLAWDFFPVIKQLKRDNRQFDTVILDPPFFSSTQGGRVDLNQTVQNLINKLRALVRNGGELIIINNALFVSGEDFLAQLEPICQSGHVVMETIVPIGKDFTGYENTLQREPISDPEPFNHSTKILILRVWHQLK